MTNSWTGWTIYSERARGLAKCGYDPMEMCGRPIGMFHCPECGCMQIACTPHMCTGEGCLIDECEDCERVKEILGE